MIVSRGRVAGEPSVQRSTTFTGETWADPRLRASEGIVVNDVFFPPSARTHWHRHERGQILLVTHGLGLVALREGTGTWIGPSDVVYFSPGEEHWHGAGPATFLVHTAISLGETEWQHSVLAEEYHDAIRSSADRPRAQ
jgi:quercetin dioxygenase-like cupin family protein